MVENKMTFYHSKGKLFLGVIVSLLFVALGVLIVNLAYIEESILFFALSLFIIVLFSFFAVANHIESLKVSETSFQPIVEIVLYDADDYFAQLSFHNKVRLCMNRVTGFSLFTISAKAVPKQERPALLETLDYVMQQKLNNESVSIEAAQKQNVETDFMEKYDPTPPINRSIDRSYFLKSYGYGFLYLQSHLYSFIY